MADDLIEISKVIVGERARKKLGALDDLCASFVELGQLQPILLTPRFELIAGERRLRAAAKLGWVKIRCVITDALDDTALALRAERDENTCRLELAPSEIVALGKRIEALHRPAASARREESKARPGQKVGASAQRGADSAPRTNKGINHDQLVPPNKLASGKVGQQVASALGVGKDKYRHAASVVDAATADAANADLVEEMDRTRKVEPAYRKLKARQKQTAKRDELLDGLGRPVPDHLRDVFGDRWLPEAIEWMNTLRDDAKAKLAKIKTQLSGKSQAYGAFLLAGDALGEISQINAAIESLHLKLQNGKPYAGCPACQAKRGGCVECRKLGWVPRWKFNELSSGVAHAG